MPKNTQVRLLTSLIAGLLLWLYASTLFHLVLQWWNDPNFQHGFFVPLFSAFVLWQERAHLRALAPHPSWYGLLLLGFGLFVLIVGRLGAELFLARFSLLLVLAGLIVVFLGWKFFRAVFFPWIFLILMIPIPTILFNQITFPLQLLTSRVAAEVLPLFGVPVLREGNIIQLPGKTLEVAEACSGIHSLISLFTLAIIYGYLMEPRRWVRWLLALAAIPIAIAANSVRIIGTGLLVQHYPDKADGYYHASWGFIIFVISLFLLYALHTVIGFFWPPKAEEAIGASPAAEPAPISQRKVVATPAVSIAHFILAILLMASAALYLQRRDRGEVFVPRDTLDHFPLRLGEWSGFDEPISNDVHLVLGPGDFLQRGYTNDVDPQPQIDLFIAYFPSQRAGDTIHSPQNCLLGAGWSPVELDRITMDLPGHDPFLANRYIVAKGDERDLVVYWFYAHGRGVASEYWSKYYLVRDAIKMNRSDGSLIRFSTPLLPGETASAAEARILPLIRSAAPLLDTSIPR